MCNFLIFSFLECLTIYVSNHLFYCASNMMLGLEGGQDIYKPAKVYIPLITGHIVVVCENWFSINLPYY